MCAGLCPTYATALDDADSLRKTETVDGSVALSVIRKTGITSLNFWLTVLNPVSDGYICMRQLDREGIKLFFRTLLICVYFQSFLRYMDVNNSRNVEKFFKKISNFLAHPVETPRPILTVLHQNVRRSVPYILNHIWKR